MKWKYKIKLNNQNIFEKIERDRNVKLPNALTDLVIEANGATPEKKLIKIAGEERVLSAILSFNEDDADSYFQFCDCVNDNNMIPFAIDPFGNVFFVGCEDSIVYYWNHDERVIDKSGIRIDELEEELF